MAIAQKCPYLKPYLIPLGSNRATIDFKSWDATVTLTRALLESDYGIVDWNIPQGLFPHHIAAETLPLVNFTPACVFIYYLSISPSISVSLFPHMLKHKLCYAGYLCPATTNRANYIHWLEDLRQEGGLAAESVSVVDVGVGANCIYPLLGNSSFP